MPISIVRQIQSKQCHKAEFLNGMSVRYFSERMKSNINNTTRVGAGRFGKSLFARIDLPKRAIIGYYSGPILTWNNEQKYASEDQYIAGGQFVHPASGKKMTYQMVVVGPTRYMNHGHCPDYNSGTLPNHGMVANARMQSEEMVEIGGAFRPIFAFRTIRKVSKGEELLYDYGVHDDEIYYEVLRRKGVADAPAERKRFLKAIELIEKARYKEWKAESGCDASHEWDSRNDFFRELLIEFLNSRDSIIYPTAKMV